MADRIELLSRVWGLYQEIEDSPYLEDHKEYDQELLVHRYELTEEQAYYLFELIQLQFDKDYRSLYDIIPSNNLEPDAQARQEAVCEVIGESMHQSLDGWSDGEKVIITRYLMDLGIATNLTLKSYKNRS